MGPTVFIKTVSSMSSIKTEFNLVFILFTDSTDMWQPAIGSFFNFFFLSDPKKSNKNSCSVNYVLRVLTSSVIIKI